MRKWYSIGILIMIISSVFLFIFIYKVSYKKAIIDMEAELLDDVYEKEDYYYIKSVDGYVAVYLADKKTLFENTSISTSELPEEIQEELEKGKRIDSLGQVYGFLENYSS